MVFTNWLEILFTVTEVALLILKRSEKDDTRSNRDRRSLLLLWLVIWGSITYTSFTEHDHTWPLPGDAGLITGIIIFGLGFIIRWTAIVQLGKMFTVNVAINKDHSLNTRGLYKIVRHPSYLGLLMILAGIGFSMNSMLNLLIIVIPCFLALSFRISVEEAALTDYFGEQYRNYKSRVARLIPWVY
jgi:protein-S-isoprenylcysteine O-methyltransferase Ste14